jgi:precorrin-4 methylase
MSLGKVDEIVKELRKYYSEDTPVAVVYFAGDPRRQRVIKSTLRHIKTQIEAETEKEMGLIYVGDFLNYDYYNYQDYLDSDY